MKKKNLLILLISLTFILASLTILGITYGWIADVIDVGDSTISVGDLRYSQNGAFITDGTIIHPNEELIDTDIDVTNSSPISSQLRVQITYTQITNPGGAGLVITQGYIYTDSVDEHISVVFDSSFTYDNNYWYYNGTTGTLAANSGLLEIISSIQYAGENTNIDYVGQDVAITVTIQVKQSDNSTWTDLVGYDFSTGEPS